MSKNSLRKQIVERAEEYLYEQHDGELSALQKALQHARRRQRRDATKPRKDVVSLKGIRGARDV